MVPPSQTALLQACRTLFGQDVNLSHDFLSYLQHSGAKIAYRTQAKEHHPDRFANSPTHIREQQTERFREINQAYNLVKSYLDNRSYFNTFYNTPKTSTYQPTENRYRPKTQTPRREYSRVPAIPLEFGMYAYYLGKVSYHDLIDALVWQRRQRPSLGNIARQWGWLNESMVMRILRHRGESKRFGGKAIELGYLSGQQLNVLLHHQRSHQRRIGEYFIEKGLMTTAEADRIARELKVHNHKVSQQSKRRSNSRP